MIEAVCGKCGETFIPHSEEPEDLIHGETEAGEPCGGTGTVRGEWVLPAKDLDAQMGVYVDPSECVCGEPDICWAERAEIAKRERDEARAQVDRVRAQADALDALADQSLSDPTDLRLGARSIRAAIEGPSESSNGGYYG